MKFLTRDPIGLQRVLQDVYGVKAFPREDYCLASRLDPALSQLEGKILSRLSPIELESTKYNEIAIQMMSLVPKDYDDIEIEKPTNINTFSEFGVVSDAFLISSMSLMAGPGQLRSELGNRILPMMAKVFRSTQVVPVVVDPSLFQGQISLRRFLLLTEQYETSEIAEVMRNHESLYFAMPDSAAILRFVDSLLVYGNIALSFSVQRLGCAWHFVSKRPGFIPHCGMGNLISNFAVSMPHGATAEAFPDFSSLMEFENVDVVNFISFCVSGVDRMLAYLCSPHEFVDADGFVQNLNQIQMISTLYQVFSDLDAINQSSQSYQRTSFAFSAIDKLANMVVGAQKRRSQDETKFFCSMVSVTAVEFCCELVASSRPNLKILSWYETEIRLKYEEVHKNVFDAESKSESSGKPERVIRQMRNLQHGSFLTRQGFETLFLNAPGRVPTDLSAMPVFLVLALISDPRRFLFEFPLME